VTEFKRKADSFIHSINDSFETDPNDVLNERVLENDVQLHVFATQNILHKRKLTQT